MITLLHEKNIQSLIVEGGQKTLSYFIKNGLWDTARVFKTERILNDGLVSPILNKNEHTITTFGSDKLYTYNNDWIESIKFFGHLIGILFLVSKKAKLVFP